MKFRVKFAVALLRNILLKARYGGRIEINPFKVYIDPSVRVEISAEGRLIFMPGRRIYIDRGGLIRASGGTIKIGAGFFANQGCMIVSHESISVGSEVMLGPGVCIFDSDHAMVVGRGPFSSQGYEKRSVTLGDNVWIGAHAVVTRGCVVGSDTVVAANSVARGQLESASVYAGVPVKKVKSLGDR